MTEHYYEAAIRHFIDADILQQEECYDNSVCLFGFSAECALKALIKVFCGENCCQILQYKYGHNGDKLIHDLYIFITNASMISALDPALGLKLHDYALPQILFSDHPDRRYAGNDQFSGTDVEYCKAAVIFLIKEMISQHVDGYI